MGRSPPKRMKIGLRKLGWQLRLTLSSRSERSGVERFAVYRVTADLVDGSRVPQVREAIDPAYK